MGKPIRVIVLAFFAALVGCAAGVDDSPYYTINGAPSVGACDGLPEYFNPPPVDCVPGETVAAICRSGSMGYRKCNSAGSGWSRAYCWDGFGSLNQEADYLVVTRPQIVSAWGFDKIMSMRNSNGLFRHRSEYVTVDDLVRLFPAPTVPESVRLGLRHIKRNELPGLKFVVLLGKPSVGVFENVRKLTSATEMPLWYVRTPPGMASLDLVSEEAVPTTLPYGYLRGDWPADFGGRFWTPDFLDVDVHVGLLPLTGGQQCKANAVDNWSVCRTDLQDYADKVTRWEETRDRSFVRSQFDGAACHGEDWGVENTSDLYPGVTLVNYRHDCSGGELGDMASHADADGADYLFYAWHGNSGGSPDGEGYTYSASTGFTGMVFGHSCSTGAPDLDWVSLGASQIKSDPGAVAYMGYPRVASVAPLVDPMDRAFVAGRFTVGEAVDGARLDVLRNLGGRNNLKDWAGLVLFGDPALPIVPSPWADVSLSSTAAVIGGEGLRHVCIDMWDKPEVDRKIMIGGTEIGTVNTGPTGRRWFEAVVSPDDSRLLVHSECDPRRQICQVAAQDPEPSVRLDCRGVWPDGGGGHQLEFGASRIAYGSDLTVIASVISEFCPEGLKSSCYLDSSEGRRRESVVGSADVSVVYPGENLLPVSLDNYVPEEQERFRAIVVRLWHRDFTLLGQCYVPFSDYTGPESLGLL